MKLQASAMHVHLSPRRWHDASLSSACIFHDCVLDTLLLQLSVWLTLYGNVSASFVLEVFPGRLRWRSLLSALTFYIDAGLRAPGQHFVEPGSALAKAISHCS